VGKAELDIFVQLRDLWSGLGSVHLVGRHAVAEALEHVAVFVQRGRHGVAGIALDAVLAGKCRNGVPWLGHQQDEAERYQKSLYA